MKKYISLLTSMLLIVSHASMAQTINTIAGTGSFGYTGDGWAASVAQTTHPYSVATDKRGNAYIADYENNVIRKIDRRGIISRYVGTGISGFSGDGGQASAARLAYPIGLAVDAADNLYFSDQNNHVIRKVSTSGIISTVAGSRAAGYSGDGGAATSARLRYPVGVSVDAAGNIYIADYLNHAIRKVNTSGIITTIAGNGGSGYSGDGGPASSSAISEPRGVTTDATGNVYFTDYGNHTVRKINTAGIITTIAGTTVQGYGGDGGPATAGIMNHPFGITTDVVGNIYVSELHNHHIRKIDLSGIISIFAGDTTNNGYAGDGGPATAALMDQPMGLSFDTSGTLFFTDNANRVIRVVGAYDRAPYFVHGNNYHFELCHSVGTLSLDSLLTGNDFDTSETITWSVLRSPSHGSLSCSYSISSTGSYLSPTGLSYTPSSGYGGPDTFIVRISDGTLVTDARFTANIYSSLPNAGSITGNATVEAGDYILLADTVAGGIWASSNTAAATIGSTGIVAGVATGTATISYTLTNPCGSSSATKDITIVNAPPSPIIYAYAGNGTSGYSGDGSAATAAQLNKPRAVAADATGNVYIADNFNNVVRKVDVFGNITTVAGTGSTGYSGDGSAATAATFNSLSGIATDATGNIYIVDGGNHCIRKIATTGIITTIAGNGTLGFSGDGGAATAARLHNPYGLAIDASGNLYVADVNNNRIRKIDNTGTITTVAGNGVSANTGNGGPATAASIGAPQGVALDASGNLYIADRYYNVVRKVTTTGTISTVAGDGTFGFSGNGGLATSARLRFPTTVAVDGSGNIFIAEEGNFCIRRVNTSGIISTYAGIATDSGYSGNGGPANMAELSAPASLSFNSGGNLFIADYHNYVVRVIGRVTHSPVFAGGSTQNFTTCQDATPVNIDTLLSVNDIDTGKTINWSVATPAVHGTLAISYSTTTTGTNLLPSGLTYQPTTGYNGTDSFAVAVTDGSFTVYTTVHVTVLPLPAAISGIAEVCLGNAITLSNSSVGGTWSSGSSLVSVNSASGVVTGISAGTAEVTYSIGCGETYKTVTVHPLPASITGGTAVCEGSTITLASASTGGTWASSSADLVIGSASGIATGIAAGVSVVSYTLPTGCQTGLSITIHPLPSAITGTMVVCENATTTLSNSTSGGIWTSGSIGAAVGSANGIVTGLAAGTATISYTLPTGCQVTTIVTVNPLPASITGATGICEGATSTLASATAGGEWTSSNSNAVIGSTSGIVSGIVPGTATISYTLPTGCATTLNITIHALPAAITGQLEVCIGNQSTISSTTTGGTWTASNTNCTIGSASGIITGATAGTTDITYTLPTGCTAFATATTHPLPAAISGTAAVCVGASSTLSSTSTGGVWSASNGNTNVGSATGVITGASSGNSTITYTLATGCIATIVTTVHPLPGTISGTLAVCEGLQTTLTNAATGGNWTSGSSNATINLSSGIATGVTAGTASITYTLPTGCTAVGTLTIHPVPATITGTAEVCEGSSTTLANTSTGGVWTSSNSNVIVGSANGVVTGSNAGTSSITYTLPTGCIAIRVATVHALPAAISGTLEVCVGNQSTVSSASAGGTWIASNGNCSIGSATGIITGLSAGNSVITYTLPTGCMGIRVATVHPLPAAISGSLAVCEGSSITVSCATIGGLWTASNSNITIGAATGIISGSTAGTTTVTYTLPTGCISTASITVNALPSPISGATSVCDGATTTLTTATTGGSWSIASGAASIGAGTGIVSGLSAGSTTITYTTAAGCIATMGFSVNPLPSAISGTSFMCSGFSVTLSNAILSGTWSSSDLATATVNATTGIVTGVAAGTASITYTLPCGIAVRTVTVLANPAAITGATNVCDGSSTTLSCVTPAGTWSSTNPGIVSINSLGVVTSLGSGTATISYTLANGCASEYVFAVDPIAPILGSDIVCLSQTSTLSNTVPGGIWTSSAPTIASVGSADGVVTGIVSNPTIPTITYTLPSGCRAMKTVTVIQFANITGASSVCGSQTITLGNTIIGGTWTSGNNAMATVDASSGVVTGVGGGNVLISYTNGGGCVATKVVSVSNLGIINGPSIVCLSQLVTLSNIASGGTWTSSHATVASVNASTGVVTGIVSNSTIPTITYTLPNGCQATKTMSVITFSAITGVASAVCSAQTITIANATPGGVWSSSDASVATIGSTGIITGGTGGTAIVSYSNAVGCVATRTITVSALTQIEGPSSVCLGQFVTLSNATSGGTWTSSHATIASVGSTTGIVRGIVSNSTIPIITYTLPGGCRDTIIMRVNPLFAISAFSSVCMGQVTNMTNATPGGTWASSNNSLATVGTAGAVTGVAAGTATITYTTPVGCETTKTLTINELHPINGSHFVCVGQFVTLSSASTGGTWTSSFSTIASVGSASGIVRGVSFNATVPIISYTLPNGCRDTSAMRVNNLVAITGVGSVCMGQAITLGNTVTGGTWVSSNQSIATIGTSGAVTGVASGTVTFSYTNPAGCIAEKSVTVNQLTPIEGLTAVCQGQTITLSNPSTGGNWASSSTATATVGSASGIVTGVTVNASNIMISYTLPNGCRDTSLVKVNACGKPENEFVATAATAQIRVVPNPSSGTFTVTGHFSHSEDKPASIELTNMLGQVVFSDIRQTNAGAIQETIAVNSSLPNGMYILTLRSGEDQKVFHLVMEK